MPSMSLSGFLGSISSSMGVEEATPCLPTLAFGATVPPPYTVEMVDPLDCILDIGGAVVLGTGPSGWVDGGNG